ncbi:MAG: hypothetical protein ACRDWS_14640 [Acidimicrobiia bacterium]
MKRWMKPVGIAMACLACCLPLIFAIAGVTTGAAGAVGYWLGRNEALLVAGLGISYLLTVIIRHTRASRMTTERLLEPTRKTRTS